MRIVFIGTGEIGVPTLRLLREWREHELVGIVTQPDKPVGRDQKITPPPIKAATQQLGVAYATSGCELELPVLQPARIKMPEAIEAIRRLNPDVIVVMAYGQILPREVLEIPKIACLNLHASILPRWRGAAPIQAAIAAGDRETGVTVMYMDEGLDTGDILLEKKIGIARTETGGSLHDRLAEIAPEALRRPFRSSRKERHLALRKRANLQPTHRNSNANTGASIGPSRPTSSREKSAHSIPGQARSRTSTNAS
jgi:Methionyl-tRNA formyltransferase